MGLEISFIDEARQLAAQCWCDPQTQVLTMDPQLAESVAKRIAFWMEEAARQTRNVDFYRAIIYQIGELFGDAAKTSDDGTIQDDVLALRVPELIKVLVEEHDRLRAENERLRAGIEKIRGWAEIDLDDCGSEDSRVYALDPERTLELCNKLQGGRVMTEQEWDECIDGRVVFIKRLSDPYWDGVMIYVDGKEYLVKVRFEDPRE